MKTRKKSSYFSYKNDDIDLVELGQFLRETTKYKVEREWHILFEKDNGAFVDYNKTVPDNPRFKSRNPDLMLINKKTKKLVLIIEIDGSVHDYKVHNTEERNEDYENAGIFMEEREEQDDELPKLLVINMLEIDTTIFDYVTRKIQERLSCI